MPRSSRQDPARTVDRHVGARLQARRLALGMTARDVEEAAGFPRGSIGKIETGRRTAGASHLFRLASLLETEVDYFFSGLPFGNEGENVPYSLPSHEETQDFIRLFNAVEQPGVRQGLMDMMKALGRGQPDAVAALLDETP